MDQMLLDLNLRIVVDPSRMDLFWADGSGQVKLKDMDDESLMILLEKGDITIANIAQTISRSLLVEATVMHTKNGGIETQ